MAVLLVKVLAGAAIGLGLVLVGALMGAVLRGDDKGEDWRRP